MIARGTTPTITYRFKKVAVSDITVAYLTIVQGSLVYEKTLAEAEVGDDYISWDLTQSETLSFDDKKDVEFECRYKTADNHAYKTAKKRERVEDVLKDGEI